MLRLRARSTAVLYPVALRFPAQFASLQTSISCVRAILQRPRPITLMNECARLTGFLARCGKQHASQMWQALFETRLLYRCPSVVRSAPLENALRSRGNCLTRLPICALCHMLPHAPPCPHEAFLMKTAHAPLQHHEMCARIECALLSLLLEGCGRRKPPLRELFREGPRSRTALKLGERVSENEPFFLPTIQPLTPCPSVCSDGAESQVNGQSGAVRADHQVHSENVPESWRRSQPDH